LPAALFVVLHVRPDVPSQLPAILNRLGALPAAHAVDGERIRRGRIYVAPPGMQTYLEHGRIGVRRGPPENLHRPSIDALFRTAAHHFGPRVVGIVLSGSMDDGAAGLHAIKRGGGVAVVQDPADAAFPAMPENAIEAAPPDYCVPAGDVAALLTHLVADGSASTLRDEVALETRDEAGPGDVAFASEELGLPSAFTCPDCGGTLFEIDDGNVVRYRCRVGHAYSEQSMDAAEHDSTERALWAAQRALEERVALMRKMASHARRRGHAGVAGLFEERAERFEADVRAIHAVIVSGRTLEPVES
jgi:two-component system chemotaxis response regulator CheB